MCTDFSSDATEGLQINSFQSTRTHLLQVKEIWVKISANRLAILTLVNFFSPSTTGLPNLKAVAGQSQIPT
jgi:hypothetical protein